MKRGSRAIATLFLLTLLVMMLIIVVMPGEEAMTPTGVNTTLKEPGAATTREETHTRVETTAGEIRR